jgi:hypothetical protein
MYDAKTGVRYLKGVYSPKLNARHFLKLHQEEHLKIFWLELTSLLCKEVSKLESIVQKKM